MDTHYAARFGYLAASNSCVTNISVDFSTSANAVFSFVKVRAKRRSLYALPPLESPPSFPAATTKAREFFTSPSTKQPHETKQRPYNI